MRLPRTILLTLALAACGDDSSGPSAGGRYIATLTGHGTRAEGAAVIELSGAGLDTVTATTGSVFTQRSGTTMRVVVVRDAPGAIEFAVELAPGSGTPRATVIEVADGDDQLRTSLTGYRVRFAR